jgi:hypothetical protein
LSKAKSRSAKKNECDLELAEQFVCTALALEEQQELNELGLQILADLQNYHLREMHKLKAELTLNPTAKNLERLKDKALTSGVILDFGKMFRVSLVEFRKALDEIADAKLRYRIALHSREMAAYARILGNIARRNILEERRDQINGQKSKTSEKVTAKTNERQLKVEEKILAALKDNPSAEWDQIWKKVRGNGTLRKLASRNTLEKDARAAYQKHFIEPPH